MKYTSRMWDNTPDLKVELKTHLLKYENTSCGDPVALTGTNNHFSKKLTSYFLIINANFPENLNSTSAHWLQEKKNHGLLITTIINRFNYCKDKSRTDAELLRAFGTNCEDSPHQTAYIRTFWWLFQLTVKVD